MTKEAGGRNRKFGGLILLKDLAPRKDPKGGAARKTVFGELPPEPDHPRTPGAPERAPRKPKRPKP